MERWRDIATGQKGLFVYDVSSLVAMVKVQVFMGIGNTLVVYFGLIAQNCSFMILKFKNYTK